MRKLKEQSREANSRGWRRYFYGGIRNRARSRLILVGTPTQSEAHARAKHLGRVTPYRAAGLLHAQVVLRFGLLSDAPRRLHYRASGRNTAGLVPSCTQWRLWHKCGCHSLAVTPQVSVSCYVRRFVPKLNAQWKFYFSIAFISIYQVTCEGFTDFWFYSIARNNQFWSLLKLLFLGTNANLKNILEL
jgi:hypothetical protein